MVRVTAILTAAGESTRMGTPKPLLEWQGTTMLEYQVASLLKGGADDVIVVLGHRAGEIQPLVNETRARGVVNADYAAGRSSSVVAGVRELAADVETVLLLAVDQPRPPEVVAAVLGAHLGVGAIITSPLYKARGGHPLVFDASLRHELESITEAGEGLRQVFRSHRHEVNEFDIDDPVVRLDLNTPEQYEEAKALYGQ